MYFAVDFKRVSTDVEKQSFGVEKLIVYKSIERNMLSQKCQFSPPFGHLENESDSLRCEEHAQTYWHSLSPPPLPPFSGNFHLLKVYHPS